MIKTFLLCASLGATIYDDDASHPWNQLYEIFYTHKFSNGDVYSHEATLEPPWFTWGRFHNDEDFFREVAARLEAFQKLPAAEVEEQPALRRALLLRDLWPVFEVQSAERLTREGAPRERQRELRDRLAKVMRRLELTETEIRQLPDTLKFAGEKGFFPAEYGPQTPEAGFLPANLCDDHGPWVVYSKSPGEIGASQHVTFSSHRSVFTLHLWIGDEQQAAIRFLEMHARTQGSTPVPKGTRLALLRRAILPASTGKPVATSLVESLQIIVAEVPEERRYKFVLDRAGLLRGRAGLRFVRRDDPVDIYGFGGGILSGRSSENPRLDSDGEPLVYFAHVRKPAEGIPPSPLLFQCASCHGGFVGNRLFANCHIGPAYPSTVAEQTDLVVKERSRLSSLSRELRR